MYHIDIDKDIENNMISRTLELQLQKLSKGYPVIAITGPRQSGKTTLAKIAFPDYKYVSLEDPDALEFSLSDPRSFLDRLRGGGIIDEIQKSPKLFSYIQGIVDNDRIMGQFVITGSQQFGIFSDITQSLAGRVALAKLLPFSLNEIKAIKKNTLDTYLFNGFYPPLYDRELDTTSWLNDYIQTYIERDVRQLINIKDLSLFKRFLRLCAARNAQLINYTELATSCGITQKTLSSWLSVLEASYIIYFLKPHFKNFNKRLVKSSKLYFYDSGLCARLLGIQNIDQLSIHPFRGQLFEGFIITEFIKEYYNIKQEPDIYFWRNNKGKEIDLIIEKNNQLIPIEIKSGQTITTSFFNNLKYFSKIAGQHILHSGLIYGGQETFIRNQFHITSWQDTIKLASMPKN